LSKTTFLLATMLLCAACAGPAASANSATAGPAAGTGGDAPLLQGPDLVCETVRPTGSNIAERTCRPRAQVNQANQLFPVHTPSAPPPGGGGG
jgi:hypothetical protein